MLVLCALSTFEIMTASTQTTERNKGLWDTAYIQKSQKEVAKKRITCLSQVAVYKIIVTDHGTIGNMNEIDSLRQKGCLFFKYEKHYNRLLYVEDISSFE